MNKFINGKAKTFQNTDLINSEMADINSLSIH